MFLDPPSPAQDSSAVFNSLWTYTAGVWQLLPSLKNQPCANWPLPRFSHSVVTRQSSFVIFGGSGMFWPFGDIWQYTEATCWTQLNVTNTSIVPHMFRHMAAYDPTGDAMYVSGGIYISSSTANASTVLWQYSFGSSSWSALPLATPFGWRVDSAMVCHGSALWQWGGALFPTFEMADMDLYRLDLNAAPSARAWIRVAATSAVGFYPPRPRSSIAYAYVPNGIPFLNTNRSGMLIFAGYSPRQATGISHSSIYFLDLVSQQWQQVWL